MIPFETFEIEFFANNVEYNAKVHKIPADNTLPVEFHVFNIRPGIPKAPRTFTFVYNPEEATFDCTIFDNDADLSENMFTSIKNHCKQSAIALQS